MIRAAALPQIAIQGGYGYQENKYQVHEGIWSAMIGVEWHIFDKGISRHRSAGLLNQSTAQLNLRNDLSSKIRLAVRQIWFDINETKKRIAVTKTAVSRSEENLNVSKDRYRKGLGINTEVLDAETLRTKSYTNYNNAIYDNILAMLRMRHAVGEL
jgi:outer membrane protein TolC